LARRRQIRIECDFAAIQSRHVLADRQRLKQVLLNLLSNAVKYNRDQGSVFLRCANAQDGNLRIAVVDTGYGISPADLGRLFKAFERLAGDRGGVEGTGLGLSLSKRLVELMGGCIGVESSLGEGSTFWIDLPLAESPVQAAERSWPPGGPEMATAPAGSVAARTVLYIEDNLSNLKLIERIFNRRPSFKLLAAMQGGLGLELAREHRPDLILLDLNLPDLPGREVLRRLRGEEATAHIPVVIISADATPGEIERTRAAGAVDYLTKPIDVPNFLKVLDERLNEPKL
jgi:CheY-like chemotaxis protein